MEIIKRSEGEVIPQGISLTQTNVAAHVYFRKGDQIIHVRFPFAEDVPTEVATHG